MLQPGNQAVSLAVSSPLTEGKLRILEVLAGIRDNDLGAVRLDDVETAYKQRYAVDLDKEELNKFFSKSRLHSAIIAHFADDIQLLQNTDSPDSYYARLLRPSAEVLKECAAKRAEKASPSGGFGTRQTSNFSAQRYHNRDGQRTTFQGDRPWQRERNTTALQPVLKRHPSFFTDHASTALRFKSTTNTTLQSSSSGTSSNGTFLTNSSGLNGSGSYGSQHPRRDQFPGQHGRRFASAPNRNEHTDRQAHGGASQYSAPEDRFAGQIRKSGFGVPANAQEGDSGLRGFKREGIRRDFAPLTSVKAGEIPSKRFGVQCLQQDRDDSPTGRPLLTPVYRSNEVKTAEMPAQLKDGSSRYARGAPFGATVNPNMTSFKPPNPVSMFARASISTDEERSDDATQQRASGMVAPVPVAASRGGSSESNFNASRSSVNPKASTFSNQQTSSGAFDAQRMGSSSHTDATSMAFKTSSSGVTDHRQFGSQQAKPSFGSSGSMSVGRDLDQPARRFGGNKAANQSLVHSSSSDQSIGSSREANENENRAPTTLASSHFRRQQNATGSAQHDLASHKTKDSSMRTLFVAPVASTVDPAKLDDHSMLANAIVMIVAMSRKDRITIRELEDVLKLQCHRDVSPGSESGLDISWTEYIRRFCSAVFVEDDGIQEPFCVLHKKKSVVASQINDYVKHL